MPENKQKKCAKNVQKMCNLGSQVQYNVQKMCKKMCKKCAKHVQPGKPVAIQCAKNVQYNVQFPCAILTGVQFQCAKNVQIKYFADL